MPDLTSPCKLAALSSLRNQVRAIERGDTSRDVGAPDPHMSGAHTNDTRVQPFGLGEIDSLLPEGGLVRGRVHEVLGESRSEVRDAACFGFTAALAGILSDEGGAGTALWCTRQANVLGGGLYARGLVGLGVDPGRLVEVVAPSAAERLRVMEEALRCSGLAVAIVELDATRGGEAERIALRRLRLAAEDGGVTGLILRPRAGEAERHAGAVETRWMVSAAPSPNLLSSNPSSQDSSFQDWAPHWRVELAHARNGRRGAWTLAWRSEERRFMIADICSIGKGLGRRMNRHGVAPDTKQTNWPNNRYFC